MKSLLLAVGFVLLTSCTTTHNHYHQNDDNNYVQSEVLHHYVQHHHHDHIVVMVKHRHKLSKSQRQRIRRWCHRHYGHHRKRIKCQFVLG